MSLHRSRLRGEDDDDLGAAPPSFGKRYGSSISGDGGVAGPKQDDDIPVTPSLPSRTSSKPPAMNNSNQVPFRSSEARASAGAGRLGETVYRSTSDDEELRAAKLAARGSPPGMGVAAMPPPSDNMVVEDLVTKKTAARGRSEAPAAIPGAVAVAPITTSTTHEMSTFVQYQRSSTKSATGGFTPIAAKVVEHQDVENQVNERVRQETQDIADEVQRRIIGQAVVADVMDPSNKQPTEVEQNGARRRKWAIIFCTVVVLAVIGAVVGVVVSQSSNNNDDSGGDNNSTSRPTSAPTSPVPTPTTPASTPAPTDPPTAVATDVIQGRLEQEFGPIDTGTPQAEALNWLINMDPLQMTVNTPFRILKERYIVLVLYFATEGSEWTDGFVFLGGTSVCSWNDGSSNPLFSGAGVFCNGNEAVTHIRLEGNNLQGSLPPEVTALETLEVLDLRTNRLQGSIPENIGNLFSMKSVDLAENFLTGTLPTELFDLPDLEELYLFLNTELSGTLPDTVGTRGATGLKSIGISDCKLSGTLPKSLALLSSLEFINLAGNALQGSLPAFRSPSINDIFLRDNNLDGEIPKEIGELLGLQQISISDNDFRGPIPLFTGSRSLTNVWLYGNSLTGTVEQFLTPLLASPRLETIDISSNKLVGSIPPLIGEFSRLTNLQMELNDLGGDLPSEIGLLSRLFTLDLFGVGFGSSIPSELGLLTSLDFLDLGNNNLFGTRVPSEMGDMTNLRSLNLPYNGLVGTLPTEIAAIPTLEELWLQGNEFDGSLDSFFCERSNPLTDFRSDCAGVSPEMQCDCCTICCDTSGFVCEEVTK